MKRKIISIAIEPDTSERYGYLYALCDDGTIWAKRTNSIANDWHEIDGPKIPDRAMAGPDDHVARVATGREE